MLHSLRAYLVFAVALFLLSACSSSKETTPLKQIDHSIEYSAKGTRSEARHGFLSYRGIRIPDVFEVVDDGRTRYRFKQRSQMWGDDGYQPVGPSEMPEATTTRISKPALKQGWYLGRQRFSATPRHWVYLQWEKDEAFADPGRINGMVEDLELPTIERLASQRVPFPSRSP